MDSVCVTAPAQSLQAEPTADVSCQMMSLKSHKSKDHAFRSSTTGCSDGSTGVSFVGVSVELDEIPGALLLCRSQRLHRGRFSGSLHCTWRLLQVRQAVAVGAISTLHSTCIDTHGESCLV